MEIEHLQFCSFDILDFFCFEGNKKLLPVFVGSGPRSKRARREGSETDDTEVESTPEGFLMYKGSLLDIDKLVNQLKRSEDARLHMEKKMMDLQHEATISNDKAAKQTICIKDLSDDLRSYKDKLKNSDEKLKKTTVSGNAGFLSTCDNSISTFFTLICSIIQKSFID